MRVILPFRISQKKLGDGQKQNHWKGKLTGLAEKDELIKETKKCLRKIGGKNI